MIYPMEPILSNNIISDKNWIHQIKWDGIRGISYIQDNQLRIFTKKGNERTDFYPELHETVKLLKGKQAVLDGEIVVFDRENKPSFSHILVREKIRSKKNLKHYISKYPVNYIIFDILYYNNEDLRNLPLKNRKEILVDVLAKSKIITITDDFNDGEALFNLMKEKNYEGIVSKNLNSKYISGKKHDDWFKTKISKKILTVIGGINLKDDYPKSLMVGIYKDDKLIYIGDVSLGLKSSDLQLIKKYSQNLYINESLFTNLKTKRNVIWFEPLLTCWVNFMDWTNKGSLRHPKIIGFSKRKPKEADGTIINE